MGWRRVFKKLIRQGKSSTADLEVRLRKGADIEGEEVHPRDVQLTLRNRGSLDVSGRKEPTESIQYSDRSMETLYGDAMDRVPRDAYMVRGTLRTQDNPAIGGRDGLGRWVTGRKTMMMAMDQLGLHEGGLTIPGQITKEASDLHIMLYSSDDAGTGYEIASVQQVVPKAQISVVAQGYDTARRSIETNMGSADSINWADDARGLEPDVVIVMGRVGLEELPVDLEAVAREYDPAVVKLSNMATLAAATDAYRKKRNASSAIDER